MRAQVVVAFRGALSPAVDRVLSALVPEAEYWSLLGYATVGPLTRPVGLSLVGVSLLVIVSSPFHPEFEEALKKRAESEGVAWLVLSVSGQLLAFGPAERSVK